MISLLFKNWNISKGAGINGKNIQDVHQISDADEYHGSAKIMDLVTGLYVTNADIVSKMADYLKSVKWTYLWQWN